MSGYKTAVLQWLVDANNRPIGIKEQDGDETFIPTFNAAMTGLIKPDGSVASIGAGGDIGMTATAFQDLAANRLVYMRSDGTLALADATAEGKEAIGFTRVAFGVGVVATFYNSGTIASLSGLTPGAGYFMTTTPGIIGSAPATTGNVVLRIGTALSATELIFALASPVTL